METILSTDINENKKWQEDQQHLFNLMYNIKDDELIQVDDIILKLHSNVFSPKHFPESKWYASTLANRVVKAGDDFLEIGTGSGISSLYVASIGANVTSVDINPDAVNLSKLNFQLNNLKSNIFQSDVYNSIPSGSKFKYIFFNHPWQYNAQAIVKELQSEKTLDEGYKILSRYISESSNYLTNDGSLLLGTCNFAKIEQIKIIAKQLNYEIQILHQGQASLNVNNNINEVYYLLQFNKLSI